MQEWQAHSMRVQAIVHAGSRVYTLSVDGTIRGWLSSCAGGVHSQQLRCVLSRPCSAASCLCCCLAATALLPACAGCNMTRSCQ